MKYLKEFSTESEYLTYRDGKDYIKPNVSLCDDNGGVYYNFTPPPIVYEAVDLGLPSGTKWASQNVGAKKPSDYGLYFQWGDTSGYTADQVGTGDGKKKFASDWSDYKWHLSGDSDDNIAFTKYTTSGSILEMEDDAAYIHMGVDWHIPTFSQLKELTANTTTALTTSDGISGMTFTSKKDTSKSIFIPNAGYAKNGSVQGSGDNGNVWSSMIVYDKAFSAGYFYLSSLYINVIANLGARYQGYSVRGVIDG